MQQIPPSGSQGSTPLWGTGLLVAAVGKVLADPTGMQAMWLEALELVKERFAQATGTAEYLALLSCDSAMALGSNLCSEPLREAQ